MLSISIVIYILEPEILKELLSSLSTSIQSLPAKWQPASISIIDNGNQATKIEEIVFEYIDEMPALEYFCTKKNIGYGQAHNLAIKKNDSRYHLILNPDVVFNENTLRTAIQYMEENTNVSAVAPYVCDEHGVTQHLCKRYPSILDLCLRLLGPRLGSTLYESRMYHYENKDKTSVHKPVEVDLISGCFMLCKTEYLKQIGGFDKRYFLYFEDFSLSLELTKFGKIVYLPEMKIIHYGGNASRKGLKHILMFISSGYKFFNQYGWKLY